MIVTYYSKTFVNTPRGSVSYLVRVHSKEISITQGQGVLQLINANPKLKVNQGLCSFV